MKKALLLSLVLISLVSCSTSGRKDNNASLDELTKCALTALSDSSTTWKQTFGYVNPLADSLIASAKDDGDLKRRMLGQKFGYLIMDMTIDKYADLKSAGEEVSESELNRIVEGLYDAMSCWFYDDTSDSPYFWRDHYYVSNKTAENPVDGYFHLMVTVPTKENPEPELHVFYPESAESMPMILFRDNETDDVPVEDLDKADSIILEDWAKKGEIEGGFPMYAKAGADVVKIMLVNEVMYLVFRSADTPDGEPGEIETARIMLEPFQRQWKESNMYNE